MSEPSNNRFPPLTIAQNGGRQVSYPHFNDYHEWHNHIPAVRVGPPMVNVDRTIYVEYEVRNVVNDVITSDTLYLLQVDTSFLPVPCSVWTTQNEALLPGRIIPHGQTGRNFGDLDDFSIQSPGAPVSYQAVDVVGGVVGTPYDLPFSPRTVTFGQSPTLYLGKRGGVFATNGVDTVNGPWSPVFHRVLVPSIGPLALRHKTLLPSSKLPRGNGLVAKTTNQSGSDTVLNFSSGGGISDPTTRRVVSMFITT